jgi:hypothetical protein
MAKRITTGVLCLAGIVFLTVAGSTRAQLINGGFETGDFTGWTYFNTVGGSTPYGIEGGGTSAFQVTLYDTAGTGVSSDSAQFEVGETSGIIGGGGLGQGAGIYQNVTLGAGQLNISLAIAATSSGNNADAGTFELLLDGKLVASDAFGGISVGQTPRSTLSYSGTIAAGTHQIAVDMRRGYGTEGGDTPYEYLDNIVISGTAVPEPTTALLTFFGLAALGVGSRRRRTSG